MGDRCHAQESSYKLHLIVNFYGRMCARLILRRVAWLIRCQRHFVHFAARILFYQRQR